MLVVSILMLIYGPTIVGNLGFSGRVGTIGLIMGVLIMLGSIIDGVFAFMQIRRSKVTGKRDGMALAAFIINIITAVLILLLIILICVLSGGSSSAPDYGGYAIKLLMNR